MKIATERRLGASDAAPLLGLSKYSTARDVFARIVLGKQKKPTKQMQRGTKFEPEVRRRYQVATGAEFQLKVVEPFIVEHPALSWATCSPDDVTVDGVLCEYKTASRWAKGWEKDETGQPMVPVDYVLQVTWGLWVTQLERAHLYVVFGADMKADDGSPDFLIGREAGPFTFTRDPELEAVFESVGGRFWREHVLARVPPAAPTQLEAAP